jgi:D-alanyl-D-alanine carboxypeptidase
VTTAKDMAILALRLMQHYPHYYKYFSTLNKTVAGIPLSTHNHLLKSYKGMDGMKTGFVNMSGFNLVASAERNKKRLITVVMGGVSYRSRDNRVVELTNIGWGQLKKLYNYHQFIGISMPQIAALNTSFRPLEANQPKAIMTASLLPNRQQSTMPQIQKISSRKVTGNAVEYNLRQVSETKNSGWTKKSDNAISASGEDEIANLIEKSQKYQNNTISVFGTKKSKSTETTDDFQPIPVEDALLYDKKTSLDTATLKNYDDKKMQQNKDGVLEWTVQVGAFSKKNAADNYLNELMKKYNNFSEARPELIAVKKGDDYIYRARFSGLSSIKAKQACSLLKRMGRYCIMTNLES